METVLDLGLDTNLDDMDNCDISSSSTSPADHNIDLLEIEIGYEAMNDLLCDAGNFSSIRCEADSEPIMEQRESVQYESHDSNRAEATRESIMPSSIAKDPVEVFSQDFKDRTDDIEDSPEFAASSFPFSHCAPGSHIDSASSVPEAHPTKTESSCCRPSQAALKLKIRENIKNGVSKLQKVCAYEFCPSPLHSNKWRLVTPDTTAGGRDWQPLLGMTLCDSCYSTYRKHGTFIRSVRTAEGWARFDERSKEKIVDLQKVKPSAGQKRSRCALSQTSAAKDLVGKPLTSRCAPRPKAGGVLVDQEIFSMEGRPSRFRKPSIKLVEAIDAGSKSKRRRANANRAQKSEWPWGGVCPDTVQELVGDMTAEREGWDGFDGRSVLPRELNDSVWGMAETSPEDDFF